MTKQIIIVGREAPQNLNHHLNWRMNSLKQIQTLRKEDLVITFPVSLEESTFHQIRELLVESVKRIQENVEKSKSEKLAFLNIDWIKMDEEESS